MVIDYLYQLESVEVNSLKYQEREAYLTVLNYLGRRARDPQLLKEIRKHMLRFLPKHQLPQIHRQASK